MPADERLRVAIVGCGRFGKASHAKPKDGLELVAISRTSLEGAEETANQIAERRGVPKPAAYDNITKMVQEAKPNLVVVASLDKEHHSNANEVLDASRYKEYLKAIIVEKPFAAVRGIQGKLDREETMWAARDLWRRCYDRRFVLDTTAQFGGFAEAYFAKHPLSTAKIIMEMPCSKDTPEERWLDVGQHVVAALRGMGYKLPVNWSPGFSIEDGNFVIAGDAQLTDGKVPVEIRITPKPANPRDAVRRFGREGNVWGFKYVETPERDGYSAWYENSPGIEVAFVKDPMRDVYSRVLERIHSPDNLGRVDARERCITDLERVLSVLEK